MEVLSGFGATRVGQMMPLLAESCFVATLALLGYALVVYPLLICLFSCFGRQVRKDASHLPLVSVVVPVFNEAGVLREKLQNCLELDYPADRLEIIFASDGSTDTSVEILKECVDPKVRVLDYPRNRGKAQVLNSTIPQVRGEIVVITDASGMLNSMALRHIMPLFHDPDVGCVCGIYKVFKKGRTVADTAESSYHGLEMNLRLWEGTTWTTLSGTGSLMAFPRYSYPSLPPSAINEDFIIPAQIALSGRRVVYETKAIVTDRISTSMKASYRRRIRIAYGNWQQLVYLKALLNPRNGYLAWVFWSHKLLRMSLPYMMGAVLICSFNLPSWIFLIISGTVVGLLGLGLLGIFLDRFFQGANPLGIIPLVFFNCAAVLVGTVKYFSGSKVRW